MRRRPRVRRAKRPRGKLNATQRREVKQLVSRETEWKQFDNITNAQTAQFTGTIIGGLILPPQGVGDSQRQGDVIFIRSVQITGNILCADATNMFRCILFRWRPDNLIDTPSIAKVLQDTVTLPYLSPINETSLQAGKINVILDKTYALVLNTTSSLKRFRWKFSGKRLGKKKIAFNSAAVTGMDQLYMLAVSDSTAISHPYISFNCRTIYSDA